MRKYFEYFPGRVCNRKAKNEFEILKWHDKRHFTQFIKA